MNHLDATDDIAKYFEANGGYDALVHIHRQKHDSANCFCTTEISGAYRKVLDVFRAYEAQKPNESDNLPSEDLKPASGHLEAQSGAGEKGRL